ncbi:Rrf2 family transcriptional regulator [Methylobacterium radiodurans]|uniref:Rrf2 family transcriptional regulator n=1 Tax=Methylobacterium radiodurans TaxID=2202828 RepID=A0A2U8VUK5_9HYPH|nr:Rrf2 family transcriptional regulator [Methylobacterium radiodurans]AWN37040.1 Rrf2 family transcriptional regulator [Methylobacterium radiodurans]
MSLYTDFSLRLLLYLGAVRADGWATTPDVARTFGISVHHLHKAVQGLARAGFVEAKQGRAGGVRLARDPAAIRLGAVVAELEGTGCLIDCGRGPCPLARDCLIKHALDAAERGFIRELDRFTLADILAHRTGATLSGLIAAGRAGREASSA